MATLKTLVVYYSRSGTTRLLATAIAQRFHADLEEIRDRTRRDGAWGYVRSLVEAVRRRPAAIEPSEHDPASYDVVVIGTPVWAGSMSSPVRSYLTANKALLRDTAFFCTLGGRGSESAFAQMRQLAGREPRACCAITAREVESGGHGAAVARFAEEIERASSARGQTMAAAARA